MIYESRYQMRGDIVDKCKGWQEENGRWAMCRRMRIVSLYREV